MVADVSSEGKAGPSSTSSNEVSDENRSNYASMPTTPTVLAQDPYEPIDYKHHLRYLSKDERDQKRNRIEAKLIHQLRTAPLFTARVHQHTATSLGDPRPVFPQFALLGAHDSDASRGDDDLITDDLVYANTSEPWSAFICGSQGSGKSHTLSCLLENSLLPTLDFGIANVPSTGIIFHYDKFTALNTSQICEAAYLCTSGIPVQVLVAPTSVQKMRKSYANLPGVERTDSHLTVAPLYFKQESLSAETIMTLMAVSETGVGAPLYISAIRGLLREMAMEKQDTAGFNYDEFLVRLSTMTLTDGAIAPLNLRLDLLRSVLLKNDQKPQTSALYDQIWDPKPGTLTIVDLSDQFINESDACALFSICLKFFIRGWQDCPRIIALDETHKFLTTTAEATKLTTDLIGVIRQQRHLSSRVVIATQEPTVAGDLLDLCNVSIVHRFNSPQWYQHFENTLQVLTKIRQKKKVKSSLKR